MASDRPRSGKAPSLEPKETSLPIVREAPVVCRKLRTKIAFGSMHPGTPDWRLGDSTTAVYWCLSTMEAAGPDDGLAHPHGCGVERGCFVPPADWDGGALRS